MGAVEVQGGGEAQNIHHIYYHSNKLETSPMYDNKKKGYRLRYNEVGWGKEKPDANEFCNFN